MTSTATHTTWCDPVEHALAASAFEDDFGNPIDKGCVGRMLVRPLADGEELDGWWTASDATGPERPLFCLDTVADLAPSNVRALLWMTSTPERVAELRALLTDALAEVEAAHAANPA